MICLDGEGTEEDEIMFCDMCGSAFHQTCYGSEVRDKLPDGDNWYCHRCCYLMENDLPPEAVICRFCPQLKGPIKRIRNTSDQEWGHLTCVNWIPEIWYSDDEL